MPELPEVQTVVDELNCSLKNRVITDIITLTNKIRYPLPDLSILVGCKVIDIKRRAKYIIVDFSPSPSLILHLGMTGKITIGEPQTSQKHDHVIFELDNGEELIFNDARRFGFIDFYSDKYFAHLGIEPLLPEFSGAYLQQKLKTKTQPIKTAIMDQQIVVGVGNIYASEALFRAKILPTRKAKNVKRHECELLASCIKQVLAEAIDSGGSTLRDYVRSSGDLGYFQHYHNVYGRKDEPCPICGSAIKMLRQAGRSSFYCKKCQK